MRKPKIAVIGGGTGISVILDESTHLGYRFFIVFLS